MKFEERSYSGRLFRPRPEVHLEEDLSLGIIATPWGPRQAATRVIEIMADYILSARQDEEATSPFQKLSCLSPLANNLRVGVMLANDSIYREENKAEYVAGVEVVVFAVQAGELAYAHVGYPQLFLARRSLPWVPLSVQMDLGTEMSTAEKLLSPLPQNVIGLHTTTNLNISSFKIQPEDRLVFLSHSISSHPSFTLPYENTTIDQVSEVLAKAYPDLPFWLGVLDLS